MYWLLKMMLCLNLLIFSAGILSSCKFPGENDPEKILPAEDAGVEERMVREGRLATLIPGMF